MGGTVALGAAVAALSLVGGLAAGGLLVAAAVTGLTPVIGTVWALVAVAAGLVAVVGLAWGLFVARLRRQAARRRAAAGPLLAVLEVALALVPRRRLAQMEAVLGAGVALGTVLLASLRREREG